MTYRSELFEFSCDLIDIQIKKYVALAIQGIGPDARLNAKLVFNEVKELLGFAEQLLAEMESPPEDNSNFINLFNQIKFYTDQEYTRAYAGWLLAENNIHSTVKERVDEQLEQLQRIAQSMDLKPPTAFTPITDIQKQCEHDSVAIAYHILDLARQIKENPNIKQPIGLPEHAFKILKTNATTRYTMFSEEIERLHHQYGTFLHDSLLEKTSSKLEGVEARKHEQQHREQFNKILAHYQKLNPQSTLFSDAHRWHQVGKIKPVETTGTTKKSHYTNNITLFGVITITGVFLISMVMKYILSQSDSSVDNTMNLK